MAITGIHTAGWHRLVGLVGVLAFISPAMVAGQHVSPSWVVPGGERFAVGVVCSGVAGALPWGMGQVRVDMHLTRTVALDADLGVSFGTGRLTTGQVPDGPVGDLHVRWVIGGRSPGGRAGYVFGGPRVIGAKNIDVGGRVTDQRSIVVMDVGYGIEWKWRNGWRSGLEFNGGVGGKPLLFVGGFLLIGPD